MSFTWSGLRGVEWVTYLLSTYSITVSNKMDLLAMGLINWVIYYLGTSSFKAAFEIITKYWFTSKWIDGGDGDGDGMEVKLNVSKYEVGMVYAS